MAKKRSLMQKYGNQVLEQQEKRAVLPQTESPEKATACILKTAA